MTFFVILISTALIILGRKALWLGLFSAVFIASSHFLSYFLFDQPDSTVWIIAGILAGICLVLYLTLEKAMVVLLGAIGGGYAVYTITNAIQLVSLDTFSKKTIAFVLGGLIGVIVLKLVFEWAMSTFSALIGAYMVTTLLPEQPIFQLALLVGLTLIGIGIQQKRNLRGEVLKGSIESSQGMSY